MLSFCNSADFTELQLPYGKFLLNVFLCQNNSAYVAYIFHIYLSLFWVTGSICIKKVSLFLKSSSALLLIMHMPKTHEISSNNKSLFPQVGKSCAITNRSDLQTIPDLLPCLLVFQTETLLHAGSMWPWGILEKLGQIGIPIYLQLKYYSVYS